ncbi:MAG: MoaD/ThiS family protein [Candidatus Bathyarchaeia archaeon]|nr:MoaD/ThiS family protein [Candidatus Bathyarchaeota archaeon]
MEVKLRLFDEEIREIIGEKEVILELQENSTIEDLLNFIVARYGNRLLDALRKPEVRILLNGQGIEFFEDKDIKLNDGDRVAIISLTSGG